MSGSCSDLSKVHTLHMLPKAGQVRGEVVAVVTLVTDVLVNGQEMAPQQVWSLSLGKGEHVKGQCIFFCM